MKVSKMRMGCVVWLGQTVRNGYIWISLGVMNMA